MPKTVADAMSRPIMVRPETPLKEAIKILAERHISGLPVVDDAGQLTGIVSETDLLWQQAGVTPPAYIMFLDSVIFLKNPADYDRDLHKALGQTVGEVMSHNPTTVSSDKPLTEAAQIMNEHKIHHLPVLDAEGQVTGILSCSDIIRAMAAEF
jgi:CBS domain-containing protein